MEDYENGMPPNDIDLTGKGISQISYSVDDYKNDQGIKSITYSAEKYNEVKERAQISSITYSTANIEGINFMTYT